MRTMFTNVIRREGIPAFVSAFYDRMEEAYTVADLAVARSGAASLTELSYFGLPTILIPYPFAAENHQFFNAEMFARHGVAEVLEESRVNGDTLGSLIDQFLNNGAMVRPCYRATSRSWTGDRCEQDCRNHREIAVNDVRSAKETR